MVDQKNRRQRLELYIRVIKKIASNIHFRNVSWNLADAIVYPLALLLATPLYLKGLGDEMYGLWTLLTSIILSIGVLNGGLGDTTIRFIAKYRALGDSEAANRVFQTTLSLTLTVAIVLLVLSHFLAQLVIYLQIFEISTRLEQESITLLTISFITLALKLLEQIFFSYFKATERFSVFSKASIASRLLTILVHVGLVLNGYGLYYVLLSTLAISFVFLVSLVLYTGSSTGFRFLMPRFDWAMLREIKDYSTWSWIQTFIGISHSQLDKFLVASLVGLQALTYYSIGLMVVNQIHMVLTTGTSTAFPMISRKMELKEDTAQLFRDLQELVVHVGVLGLLHLTVLKGFVFPLWLGQSAYLKSVDFLVFFFGYQALASASIVPYFYLLGTGHVKQNTYIMAFNTILMAVAMVVLYKLTGEKGIVLGKVLAVACSIIITFFYLRNHFFGRTGAFALSRPFILVFVAVAVLLLNSTLVSIAFILYLYASFYAFLRRSTILNKLLH